MVDHSDLEVRVAFMRARERPRDWQSGTIMMLLWGTSAASPFALSGNMPGMCGAPVVSLSRYVVAAARRDHRLSGAEMDQSAMAKSAICGKAMSIATIINSRSTNGIQP